MSKRLLALNLGMAAVAALAIVYIVKQAMTPMPMPGGGRARPTVPATTAASENTPRAPIGSYGVVTARNLFSPTRSEAPAASVAAMTAPLVKPSLFGVVLREGTPIAYLEDPATKRVAGYRVGDSIVGGTVQKISADSVVIARPDGPLDVRLRDPSRPRPPAVAQPPTGPPGAPPVAGSTLTRRHSTYRGAAASRSARAAGSGVAGPAAAGSGRAGSAARRLHSRAPAVAAELAAPHAPTERCAAAVM
jgi:hypothetical protein